MRRTNRFFIFLVYLTQNFKYLILFNFILFIILFISLNFNIFDIKYDLKPGDISPVTIISPKDIGYIDTKETEANIQEEKSKIPPILDLDLTLYENKALILDKIFELSNSDLEKEKKEDEIKSILYPFMKEKKFEGINFYDIVRFFKKRVILDKTKAILYDFYKNGIYKYSEDFDISNYYKNPLPLRIIDGNEIVNDYKQINNFIFSNSSYFEILKKIKDILGEKEYTKTVASIVFLLLEGNLYVNKYLTEQEINNRIKRIKPVKKMIKENEIIVKKGDKITQENRDQLKALKIYKSKGTITKGIFALFLSFFIIIILNILLFILIKNNLHKKNKISALYFFIFLNIFMIYIMQNVFSEFSFPLGLVFPISISCFMLIFLTDEKTAIINIVITVLIYLSFIIVYKADNIYSIFCMVVNGILLIRISKNVLDREHIIKNSFIIALVYLIMFFIYNLYFSNYIEKEEKILALFLSGLNPLLSSIFAIGLLPFFEKVFGIVTVFKLMELSNFNNPILKDMQILAPGTYHHSLLVSTIVESACKEIDANSILGRVGALYHDIGKIYMPEYFGENKDYKPNKHEEITPRMSAMIIRTHVVKGLQIAKDLKLPEEIASFIIEHHGRSLIEFFYNKALEYAEKNNETINEEDFRYLGVNPRSKETAVLMLADSVEAAIRSLNIKRYDLIKDKINEIVRKRISEGLLDNSPLTLGEIKKIMNVFEKMISSYYHTRPSYDEKEGNNGN